MKGTIKEMIYCRARFGAMPRRRGGAFFEVPSKNGCASAKYES